MALGLWGRRQEAREALIQLAHPPRLPVFQRWTEVLSAWMNGRSAEMLEALSVLAGLKILMDPEAMFLQGWILSDAGEHQAGFDYIRRAVEKGYFVVATLESATQFDPLRATPEFQSLLRVASSGREQALAAFRDAGGDRLLGMRT